MKKLILTESEKIEIRKMYGLIDEQVSNSVSIEGRQPVSGTDWDLVHGILGSKRIDDDLEKRVGDVLQTGNYRVQNVTVTSKKSGNEIVTTGTVSLVTPRQGQKPHKYFTTRGSIGGGYEQRHDTQVQGLEDRLKVYYKGEVTMFGPYTIDVVGTNYKFKQSFFAIEGDPSKQPTPQPNEQQALNITAKDLNDLSSQIKTQTQNKSFDFDTIDADLDNFTFSIEPGESKVFKLVLTFNTPEDQKNNVFPSYTNVISKNPNYSPKPVLSGDFENGTRKYSIIALYPPK